MAAAKKTNTNVNEPAVPEAVGSDLTAMSLDELLSLLTTEILSARDAAVRVHERVEPFLSYVEKPPSWSGSVYYAAGSNLGDQVVKMIEEVTSIRSMLLDTAYRVDLIDQVKSE